MQYLFVNGRWIRDRSLSHAMQEAYRGLLMTGRYAVAFLFLDLPPEQLDVNVHPTKTEVRFRDSQAMHHLVFTSIRDRLRCENLTPRLQVPSTIRPTMEMGGGSATASIPEPWTLSPEPGPQPSLPFSDPPRIAVMPPEYRAAGAAPSPSPATQSSAALPVRPFSKVIQLYDAYLVLETEQGMLVIDQHALHERILFEHFKNRLQSGPMETQKLLIPEPVELSAEQAAKTLEHREALAQLGLGVEEFGGGTVLLTSYPTILGNHPPRDLLKAVVDHLATKDRPPTREVLFNDLLSLMACHSAVAAPAIGSPWSRSRRSWSRDISPTMCITARMAGRRLCYSVNRTSIASFAACDYRA